MSPRAWRCTRPTAGCALRDRLPNVAALFEAGQISEILVRAIVWRTYLINDDAAMAAVDAELAAQISSWGALSAAKTEAAIDEMVDRHDPGALRVSRERRLEHLHGEVVALAFLDAPAHDLAGVDVDDRVRLERDTSPRGA